MNKPEISIGLTPDGLRQIEIYANTPADRAQALRMIMKTMSHIEALEGAVKTWAMRELTFGPHRT